MGQSLALRRILSDIVYVAPFRYKGDSKVIAGEKLMRNFETFQPSKTTAQLLLKWPPNIAQVEFQLPSVPLFNAFFLNNL